nr:uncharacterized protein LOC104108353 [Nicotiana tomentosiformis]
MEPYNDEHVMSHLLKFVCGIPMRCHPIPLVELYGNDKPSQLFQHLDTTTNDYVFTQLKKTSARCKNFRRSIVGGGGSWKVLDKSKPVFDKKGSVIGFKKSFRFDDINDHCSDSRIIWSMKEYSLNDTIVKVLRQRRQICYEDYVLCRITKTVNLCASSQNVPLAISGENSVANVMSEEPLMLGHLNHLNYVPSSCLSQDQEKASLISWAPSPVNQFQFQENQDSELSINLLNGNDEYISLVGLLTEETSAATLSQLPLISTEEAECSAAVEPTYTSLPPFSEPFEPLTEEELAFFDKLMDQETASVCAKEGPNNDIASYHKELDAYAAAILELNPPLVPDIPQYLEDQCPLFSEDFYIGPTALWS